MMTHKTFRSAIAIACIATLGACSSMTTREKDTAIGHELSRRRGN